MHTEDTDKNFSSQKTFTFVKVCWITYVLVCLFGIGSWVAVNGVWVELPNLINETPEGWKLASYLTVICQIANIGPIAYALLRKRFRGKDFERNAIYFLLVIGITSCLMLFQLWKRTTVIFGHNYSTALMVLTFFLALVDCTSSVTFLPYMVTLPSQYMSSLYIGETLSAFVPSIFALVQGVNVYDSNPNLTSVDYHNATRVVFFSNSRVVHAARFSQGVFFLLLAVMLLICLASFFTLNKFPAVLKQHSFTVLEDGFRSFESSKLSLLALLTMLAWLNLLQNGVVSSISSYALQPYGSMTYHLAVTIGSFSSALSCLLFHWSPLKTGKVVIVGTIVYSLLCLYVVVVALESPYPWLKNKISGKTLMVCVFVLASAVVSYSKLTIAAVMRKYGHEYLFYAGVSNQTGSFIGAVVMFFVVNFTSTFKS